AFAVEQNESEGQHAEDGQKQPLHGGDGVEEIRIARGEAVEFRQIFTEGLPAAALIVLLIGSAERTGAGEVEFDIAARRRNLENLRLGGGLLAKRFEAVTFNFDARGK